MPPPQEGQLGSFQIVRELGRGGMGVVHLARDTKLDRQVAIKSLPADVAADGSRRSRFTREAKLLAGLNHPNIATVYSLEENVGGVGSFSIVMEFVEGTTLDSYIQAQRPDLPAVLRICIQLAAALAAAHDAGVIHRDFKPQNVMVRPDGVVKVLDFGLARHAEAGVGQAPSGTGTASFPAALTKLGKMIGTPGYISPEQARGQPTDRRTDVFSFGCVLFECLSRTPIFGGNSPTDRIAALLTREPDWSLLPSGTPPALRSLLQRCLSKEPEHRLRDLSDARLELQTMVQPSGTAGGGTGTGGAEGAGGSTGGASTPSSTLAQTNLPRELTTFVGRGAELDRTEKLVRERALVTLTGSGGCGKTRLALRIAETLRAEFDDRVWVIDLAPISDAALVASTAARSIDPSLREEPGSSVIAALSGRIAKQRALIVLDNCEHVLPTAGELTERLIAACPGLKIIATSREALGVMGEQTFRVPSLTLVAAGETETLERVAETESARLLADRAALSHSGFTLGAANCRAVAKICRRLDGIPFAIELAAARLGSLTVEELAERIDDVFRVLPGASRTALSRQATLEAMMEWSHRLLTPNEAKLLRRLAVFRNGWTLAAAEEVAGDAVVDSGVARLSGAGQSADRAAKPHAGDPRIGGEPVDAVLGRLVAKSLVVFDSGAGRYRLLETVRQFADKRLDESGERAAISRLQLSHFLAYAERAAQNLSGGEQAVWLDRLHTEHDNVRAALATSLMLGSDPVPALKLTNAMHRFWSIRGHWREGRDWLNLALTRHDGRSSEDEGKTLNAAGILAWNLGDYHEARRLYEASLKIWEAMGDRRRAAAVLTNLGTVALEAGDHPTARASHDRAIVAYRAALDTAGVAHAQLNLGVVLLRDNELDESERLFMEALSVFQPNSVNSGAALHNLAVIMYRKGRFLDSLAFQRRALEIKQSLGDKPGVSRTLLWAGLAASKLGEHTCARSLIHTADQIAPQDAQPLRDEEPRLRAEALELAKLQSPEPLGSRVGLGPNVAACQAAIVELLRDCASGGS